MPTGVYPEFYDTSEDYLVWTNYITVTYLSKTMEKPPASGPQVEHVLWTAIKKENLPADSPLLKFDRTFRLARIPLGGIVPKSKDIIIDDQGVRWTIGDGSAAVEILSFGNEYHAHCIKDNTQNSAVNT